MHHDTEAQHRRRRATTVLGLAAAMVVAVAAPTLGHPVFSNDAPGFPNPQGSTTTPYPAGSRPTVNMYLPFEQEGVMFNGAENTTVDVKVTVPTGWTDPACGAASTSVDNRQVGTMVPGWNCVLETADGHDVLHWTGPQIDPPPQTFADSAQFFTFQVTVPSPATTISYGATGSPAEGFYVEQRYADGATSLWRTPNSTRPGEVANGIVRTVAAGASTPTPTPTPAPPTPTPTPAPPTPTPTPAPPTPTPTPPTPTPTPAPAPAPEPPTPTPAPGATVTTTTLRVIEISLPFGWGGLAFPFATVAPFDTAGTVQFKDGTTNLGGPVRVTGGIVIGPFRRMPPGAHSLTATFAPADPEAFSPSTSNTVTFTF